LTSAPLAQVDSALGRPEHPHHQDWEDPDIPLPRQSLMMLQSRTFHNVGSRPHTYHPIPRQDFDAKATHIQPNRQPPLD
jgi:hypothetical protein